MKTSSSKILAISDPMQVAGTISVISKEGDQTYNPSAAVFRPNRKITPTKLQAIIVGTDPNQATALSAKSAIWKVDGTEINNGNTDFVLSDDTLTLTVYQNGSINGSSITVQCTIYYINSTTGKEEIILAEKVLTTTVHDTYQLTLAPTTEINSLMNPMQDGATRMQDFGCKLVAGTSQVEANYYWYVRTINNNIASDVKVTGAESWFKGSKYYTFETNDETGEIVADSWALNDGGEIGTWAQITVDVAKTDKLMLVCKAVPTYTGVDTQNKLQNNYQQVFRASMELPVLKKVKMHAIQGYTTKHNANVTATHFKAYVDIFVGSQELNGNDDNEKSTIDEFFSVIWYKRINNKSTVIGYGATLDVTYETLGITTVSVNNVDIINEATIPEIYAEVSENYISGGVQGAVYSNYTTPNPKAVFGNDSIADELAAYLVETTYNEDNTTTIDAKRLMKNNWFRFENGQPAPTLLCTQEQYETAKASTEYNNNGEQTYLGVPVACYNPTGIDKNLDILYGWSEPVWTVEMHTNSSGEVVCYFAKEPFEIEEDGQVLSAVEIPPTLVSPGLPTLHDGKFRTMFFLDGCGYGSNGNAGAGGIITTFADEGKAWVATGISNNSNATYSFAKNADTSQNTPYAPLMTWFHNNILSALEMKYKSAILHDESMFGAGISSNLEYNAAYSSLRSGVSNTTAKVDEGLNKTASLIYDTDGKTYNWSQWLSNQRSRMVCLEPQLALSYYNEVQKTSEYIQCPLAHTNGAQGVYLSYRILKRDADSLSGKIVKIVNVAPTFKDSLGNDLKQSLRVALQMSCVHGIDLVSADVYQCQNGIENILTVEKEGQVDGNTRTIWLCKNQKNLYRGEEGTIASDEKYPFETDGTYELLGESKKTNGYGHDFLRGTCIPKEDRGNLSSISGYYYAINYGSTTIGNRNRMGYRGRGVGATTSASARCVYAFAAVTAAFADSAGGFQIRLPEKEVAE